MISKIFVTLTLFLSGSSVLAQVSEQDKLTAAKTKWASFFFTNYEYLYTQSCNTCSSAKYPWRVQISSGVPAKAVNVVGLVATGAISIDQAFTNIQTAITDTTQDVVAAYDPTYGYPTTWTIRSSTSAVGQIVNTITNFKQLSGTPAQAYSVNRRTWESQRITNYDYQYTDKNDNSRGINWPLSVKVRGGTVTSVKDTNNNDVNFLIPQSIDQMFDTTKRQLDQNAPFVDNAYDSNKGYITELYLVTGNNQNFDWLVTGYNDQNLT